MIQGIEGATAITAGGSHACAVVADGAVKCWGSNNAYQLGNVTPKDPAAPVDVKELTGATNLALGYSHSCARLENGKVKCWGSQSHGQLGDGVESGYALSPVEVVGLTDATELSSEGGGSTCAIVELGEIKCWGTNGSGELGIGISSDPVLVPTPVLGVRGATAVSLGTGSCAIVEEGKVFCWGSFGTKPFDHRGSPLQVSGLTGVTAIATGYEHACVVLADGSVECWGKNDFNQVGIGKSTTVVLTPTLVPGVSNAIAITASTDTTCALLSDSTLKCWGGTKALPPAAVLE